MRHLLCSSGHAFGVDVTNIITKGYKSFDDVKGQVIDKIAKWFALIYIQLSKDGGLFDSMINTPKIDEAQFLKAAVSAGLHVLL